MARPEVSERELIDLTMAVIAINGWNRLAVQFRCDGRNVSVGGAWSGKGEVKMLTLKRAYEKAAPEDGTRFLVERLWPRGIKKTDLRLDAWLKDVAPSDALRRWFAHDPQKWPEFQRRYFAEL